MIEVYPIEVYLIGKGAVKVSGCHQNYCSPYIYIVQLVLRYQELTDMLENKVTKPVEKVLGLNGVIRLCASSSEFQADVQ